MELLQLSMKINIIIVIISTLVTCDRGEDDRLSYMQQRLEGKAFFNIHEIYFDGENRDQIRFGESFGVSTVITVYYYVGSFDIAYYVAIDSMS